MYDTDARIADFCSREGLLYTRYVDDISISGERVGRGIIAHISDLLKAAGFELNSTKTRNQSGQKKIFTGVSIGSGAVKLPRPMRRKFSNDAFIAIKALEYGESLMFEQDPIRLERVLGQLTYWANVEPGNARVIILIGRIRELTSRRERGLRG